MAEPAPVVLCLTPTGEALANRIAPAIGAAVHGREGRTAAAVTFAETTGHVRDLFAAGVPVVGICAAGILIRSVAPLLSDKHAEPPTIAVAEDGSSVVPLLGGHRGANDLARRIAEILDIAPSITTAGDLAVGVALDAPPPGWRLGNPEDAPAAMAALVAGAEVSVEADDHAAWLDPVARPNPRKAPGDAAGVRPVHSGTNPGETDHRPFAQPARVAVHGARNLVYHPQTLALGVGCARNCPPEELQALARDSLESAGGSNASIAGVFSLDLKADEAAVLDLARELDVPFRVFPAEELEAETPRLANPSDVVFAEVGCHGVAEAAALRAAGPDADLIVEKQKTANATVAIARAPAPIIAIPGRKRGQVSLIGIGPGKSDWRTPEASRLIAGADELVGYGFYIDLLGPAAATKPRADFPLGGEEDRCRYALEEAAKGRDIAVICSGDAGIYAMGALVYELMARTQNGVSEAARRVEVVSAPGISALQAAAARIGAPLGHDFCAISLSDLLTPRADIEKRIRAAAEGDFVIAFYNPVSKRRRDLFVNAMETLSRHRPDGTPVVLATSLGRPEEHVRLRRLDEVSVEEIDMMTVVIIGSSQTRRVSVGGRDRIFTPRGYAAKHQPRT